MILIKAILVIKLLLSLTDDTHTITTKFLLLINIKLGILIEINVTKIHILTLLQSIYP